MDNIPTEEKQKNNPHLPLKFKDINKQNLVNFDIDVHEDCFQFILNNKRNAARHITESLYSKKMKEKLVSVYGRDYIQLAYSSHQDVSSDFISKYPDKVKEIRIRLVDWIFETLLQFKSEPSTFQLAIRLFDLYLSKNIKPIKSEELLLIGLSCISIASKMEDVFTLSMFYIVEVFGHNKFTREEVNKKEQEILLTIDYNLYYFNLSDYLYILMIDLCISNENIANFSSLPKLEKMFTFLALASTLEESFSYIDIRIAGTVILEVAFNILQHNLIFKEERESRVIFQWINFIHIHQKFKESEYKKAFRQMSEIVELLLTGKIGKSFRSYLRSLDLMRE